MTARASAELIAACLIVALASPVGGQPGNGPEAFLDSDVRWAQAPFPESSIMRVFLAEDSTFSSDLFRLDPVGRAMNHIPGPPIPAYEALMNEPLRVPNIAFALAAEFARMSSRPDQVLAGAAARQGYPARLHDDAEDEVEEAWREAEDPEALRDAIFGFYDGGRRLSGNARDELRRRLPKVPLRSARLIAFLLNVRHRALKWHDAAFEHANLPRGRLDRKDFDRLIYEWADSLAGASTRDEPSKVTRLAMEGVDLSALNSGAVLLGIAMDRAISDLTYHPDTPLDSTGTAKELFAWDTSAGRIVVGGSGSNVYEGPHLLIVDLGGDDRYVGVGSAVYPSRPISMILDRTGNDTYVPADSLSPGVGGALGGWSIVADLAGNDSWNSWNIGLGASIFGVGLLLDRAGDDTYESHSMSQGASAFGIGVLVDEQGNDEFKLFRTGQGFGGPLGVGLLLDSEGNDDYQAGRFSQGCGYGTDFHRTSDQGFAGGLGLLTELQGDDSYHLIEAGQGYGFRGGVGFLIEIAGDDSLVGQASSQGSADVGGLGLLFDLSGSDDYRAGPVSLGDARSASAALFVDLDGNDTYHGVQLGNAEDGGFALAADLSGDDSYRDTGWKGDVMVDTSSPLWQMIWCTGLFLDLQGLDDYSEGKRSGANGRTWSCDCFPNPAGHRHDDPDVVPGVSRWRRIGIGIDTE